MLNTKVQTNVRYSTQTTYTQYSQKVLNFILATSACLFLKSTGSYWPLGAAGAEAAESYVSNTNANIDTQNSLAIREESTLQNYPSYLTQHHNPTPSSKATSLDT